MARYLFVLLAVMFFSQSDVFMDRSEGCSLSAGQTGCTPCVRPGSDPAKPVYNKAPDVTNLNLDKTQMRIKKPVDPEKPPVDDPEMRTTVTVTAEDPEQDVLNYYYTVSGGRIDGKGATVTWDLNNVQPGTYTITAGVDDGCGLCGKTATKSIEVVQD